MWPFDENPIACDQTPLLSVLAKRRISRFAQDPPLREYAQRRRLLLRWAVPTLQPVFAPLSCHQVPRRRIHFKFLWPAPDLTFLGPFLGCVEADLAPRAVF